MERGREKKRVAAVCSRILPAAMKTLSMDSETYRRMREGEGVPPPLSREVDDLAWRFYTSGTTGRPKGGMLSPGNLVAMSLCYLADVDQATPHDASLYAAPRSHGYDTASVLLSPLS